MARSERDSDGASVRLGELVASLSLATDLGLGQPQEHIVRQTLIASRLAERLGLGDAERRRIFYVSQLAWVGCVADSFEMGRWFGDDTILRADSYLVDKAGLSMMRFLLGHVAAGSSPFRRLTMIGRFLAVGSADAKRSFINHCETTADLSERLGLGPEVRDPLRQAFERWDGKGTPGERAGEEIDLLMRIVHLANDVEALHRLGGVAAAVDMARDRRGTEFDPQLVDAFCTDAEVILGGLDGADAWTEVLGIVAADDEVLRGDRLDEVLVAFADYSDVKSPFRLGHSRGVAALAAGAAAQLGLPAQDVVSVRRAGWVHDVGVVGVSAAILDKTGPLSDAERERLRTHPYLTARTLAKVPAMAGVGALALSHHERLDGSGYPHGLTGESLPLLARVLAAADVHHALREPRPHRAPMERPEVVAAMNAEVVAGRLDGDAVSAVLAAAGDHTGVQPVERPAGLTAREVEILVLVARGMTKKDIGRQLGISAKTVNSHVEHIYTKLDVTTRGAASLFAMRHGLVSTS